MPPNVEPMALVAMDTNYARRPENSFRQFSPGGSCFGKTIINTALTFARFLSPLPCKGNVDHSYDLGHSGSRDRKRGWGVQ